MFLGKRLNISNNWCWNLSIWGSLDYFKGLIEVLTMLFFNIDDILMVIAVLFWGFYQLSLNIPLISFHFILYLLF